MGICGLEFSSTRISFYTRWIKEIIANP